MDEKKIKELVRLKYGEIATGACGCQTGCCSSSEVYHIMSEDYSTLNGYHAGADLGLGCGLPTQFAGIQAGDTVIDLGSGAGNDCFVARAETGESGRVYGIDFTPSMLEKARENARQRGFSNVEFLEGDIENIPLAAHSAEVVISNCVLNLLPSKDRIFKEIFRVLKPGGHFCVSDIVMTGELPQAIREAAEMYVGCVAGAIPKDAYLAHVTQAGFTKVILQKEKTIELPADVLAKYLTAEQIELYRKNASAIVSITLTGYRPTEHEGADDFSK